jgi:hypothetical protein
VFVFECAEHLVDDPEAAPAGSVSSYRAGPKETVVQTGSHSSATITTV